MKKCNNCDAAISCSCQQRIASDGKLVCSSCIAQYEKQVAAQKAASSIQTNNPLNEKPSI